jgi:hypothetical protein
MKVTNARASVLTCRRVENTARNRAVNCHFPLEATGLSSEIVETAGSGNRCSDPNRERTPIPNWHNR